MKRNQGNENRFPGHYRQDLVMWRMAQTGLSPKKIAKQSGDKVSADTVMRALDGDCGTVDKLWVIAEVLGLNFKELFNFDLPVNQFHRAVLNGDSSSVR